jgi:hypothetical protein
MNDIMPRGDVFKFEVRRTLLIPFHVIGYFYRDIYVVKPFESTEESTTHVIRHVRGLQADILCQHVELYVLCY